MCLVYDLQLDREFSVDLISNMATEDDKHYTAGSKYEVDSIRVLLDLHSRRENPTSQRVRS